MFSGLFSTMCAAIALTLCTWFYIYDLQIKLKDGCYWPIFGRVMPLELSYCKKFFSFLDFFPQCVQLLYWSFVHGLISMTYRSISKMVAINQFLYLPQLCCGGYTGIRLPVRLSVSPSEDTWFPSSRTLPLPSRVTISHIWTIHGRKMFPI
jgi:hypothetical protein